MDRLKKDALFALLVLAVVVAVPLMYGSSDEEPSAGLAMKQALETQKKIPNVEPIAPDKKTTTYNAIQTFSYRTHSVGDPAECRLMINGEEQDSQVAKPETLGEFKTTLEPGHYKWKVECDIANGRTITSQEWDLKVDSYRNFGDAFDVTANVVKEDTVPSTTTDVKGLAIVALGVGCLIWAVRFRKDS